MCRLERGENAYFDTGVDGTDEEDVGEDDEDSDVDSQHDRGAVREKKYLHTSG